MQHAIVLGTSMIITMFSLGFVAPEQGCSELTCFAPLCLMQPMPHEMDGRRPRPDRQGMDPKMRGPRGDREMMDEMPQRMIERVMEVAKEIDPELAEQLETMCHDDPEAFRKIIRRQGRRLASLVHIRESDPDLFEVKLNELKLDAEIFQVTKSIRALGVDEEVSQAQIATLRGLVRAKTALNIRVQTLSVNRLERHLEALKEQLADTSERFDEVVEQCVAEILAGENTKQ
ncbi:MAG: hypothetical protein H8E91_06310 [Planctomycetes bacterium]|nr:hypothetical protein [Planctomycetota bacterium]